ncbi:MAG TPA: S28 family serine protease [Longimicrobiales bacterium]|nr:S28 family serine protease [Longimicrobiales bacterium]
MSLRRRASVAAFASAVLALSLAACGDATAPDPGDLLDRLDALPGVTATEIPPHYGYPRQFLLEITQPVDHDDPKGPTFTQRAWLSHTGEDRPMVFGAYGYGASEESGEELAGLLQANGLYVTHRYFPGSRPQPTDWSHLDIRQAAADHHHIVTLLKEIYPEKWVSAGASKSGMTPLFHRRFWPGDIDATVAYVAPLMFELDDPRFLPWLAATGTPEGKAAIHAFQRRLLEHEEELLPLFRAWFTANGLTLSVPAGPVFESAVRSYEWGFWQRHVFGYGDIPGPDTPRDAWISHLATVVRLHYDSDPWRDYFKAYAYQVYTQIGGAAVDHSHLEALFRQQPLDPHVEYDFPAGLAMTWDGGAAMRDVLQWLQTQGDRIVLIYGGVDPWTGGAIDVAGNTRIVKVIQPGGDHQTRVGNLDAASRSQVLAALESWLGMDLAAAPARGIVVPPPEADPTLRAGPMALTR